MKNYLHFLSVLLIGFAVLAVADRRGIANAESDGDAAQSGARSGRGAALLEESVGGTASRAELQAEQDLARDAVSRNLVQPLEAILREVKAAAPGSVLSARLNKDDQGAWTYRLVILSPDGRYRRVIVDATRNAIIQIR